MQSFKCKGRFAELMARIPIHVVLNLPGLTGAAACGLEKLQRPEFTRRVSFIARYMPK
jgi:hypothetical protein